jgi:hypothetical protein
MNHKYKLSKYLLVLILFSQSLFAFKKLPENFYIDYELFQFVKLRNIEVEKTQISSGEIKLQYKQKNKKYDLNILLKTKKFLKFFGDKDIKSIGLVSNKGLLFDSFFVNDLKKPKKNISVTYDRKNAKLKVNYKKKLTEKINAMAHITGGGLIENIPRVIPNEFKAVISKNSWKI